MSYLIYELDPPDVPLSAIGGPPDIDLLVKYLTSSILEAKNIAVPNVFPYHYKLKLTEEISDLIRFRNQCRRGCGQKKNRELKKFVNKRRVFSLRGRNWAGLFESCRGNQTKLWNVTKILKKRLDQETQIHDFNVYTNIK
jgi:hypothetical protein